MLSNEYGIFVVSGECTVIGNNRPVVIKHRYICSTCVYHRLDSQRHTLIQSCASAGSAEVGNLRVLMELCSYSVTYKFLYNGVTCIFNIFLYGV